MYSAQGWDYIICQVPVTNEVYIDKSSLTIMQKGEKTNIIYGIEFSQIKMLKSRTQFEQLWLG